MIRTTHGTLFCECVRARLWQLILPVILDTQHTTKHCSVSFMFSFLCCVSIFIECFSTHINRGVNWLAIRRKRKIFGNVRSQEWCHGSRFLAHGTQRKSHSQAKIWISFLFISEKWRCALKIQLKSVVSVVPCPYTIRTPTCKVNRIVL